MDDGAALWTASSRKEQYKAVEAVEAPTPDTVVFRLKYPEASFIASVSSPWNWIYRAEILAKDPHWHEKNITTTRRCTGVWLSE